MVNILLFEDDPDDLEFFRAAMESVGIVYHLNIVSEYAEIGSIVTDQPYDIIFMDINMPVKNGISLLSELKEHPFFKQTPVIMLSGSDALTDIDQSYKYGAHFFLVKPLYPLFFITGLKKIFEINWKFGHKIPARENFVIKAESIF